MSWSIQADGDEMCKWRAKLKDCRASLNRLSSKKFRGRAQQIEALIQQIDLLQCN